MENGAGFLIGDVLIYFVSEVVLFDSIDEITLYDLT